MAYDEGSATDVCTENNACHRWYREAAFISRLKLLERLRPRRATAVRGATLLTTNSALLWFTRRNRELDHAADDLVAVKHCAGELGWPNGVLPPSGQLNRGVDTGLVPDLLGHSASTVRKQVHAHYQQRVLRAFDRCSVSASEAVVELEDDNALRRVARQ